MITSKAIIVYPALFEAKPNRNGIMTFSCCLLFDKTNETAITELTSSAQKAIEKGKATIWSNQLPYLRYKPLCDGDAELASGEQIHPIFKGMFFIHCSSEKNPGVIGPDALPLRDICRLYGGCIVRGDVNPFPYKDDSNDCGVGWSLNNIMLISDGVRMSLMQRWLCT